MNALELPRLSDPAPYDECMPTTPKMPIAPQVLTDRLVALGFTSPLTPSTIWTKSYPTHSYSISVDSAGNGDIKYGSPIIVSRNTVTNLLDEENLVVLDCVDSL